MVDCSTWGGDNNMDATIKSLELTHDRLTAIDRHNPDTLLGAVLEHGLADLYRKLAGGHDDKSRGFGFGARLDVVEQGEREGRSLARAGGGLADQVDTGQK